MPGYATSIFLVKEKKRYILSFLVLIFLLISLTCFMVRSAKYWLEDYYYKTGDENSFLIIEQLNTDKFNYKIKLSKYYLNKLKIELEKPISLQDKEIIQEMINNSLKYAQRAKILQPYSVLTNEVVGIVYRDVKYLGEGGSIEAINSFEDAINLEPSNPVLYTELGKEYLYIDMIDKAAISFYKALELKTDFHEAKFGLAKVLVRQEKHSEALSILNELSDIYNDAEIFFEKGRLYYNQGKIQEAIENFHESIKLDPFHYDSLYGLAVAYDSKGEKSLAHDYLQKALKINPDLEINE
jgi:tetratricopeptide (TPR) repeat protein